MSLEDTNAGTPPADDAALPDVAADTAAPADKIDTPAEPTEDDDLRAAFRAAQTDDTRDERGRFKAKDNPEPVGAQPAEGNQPDQPKEQEVEPAKPTIDAPNSWSGEMKAKWAQVSPDVQEYIARRETEQHGAITRLGEKAKAYEPFDQLIGHHKAAFEKRGIQPVQAFAVLLDAQSKLDADPVSGLVQIGMGYGIDLRPFFTGQQPEPGSTQGPSPREIQLQSRIDQLEKAVNETSTRVQTREQQEQAAREADLNSIIADFAKDKTDFDALETDIIANLTAITAAEPNLSPRDKLQKAYDRAVWANPTTRAKLQEQMAKEAEAKRLEEARKRAADAKNAGVINVQSRPAAQPGPMNEDDDLRATYRRLHAS